MKQLALVFVCFAFLFLSLVEGQTDPCLKYSNSCARCHTAAGLNCRFFWTRPGFYNSEVNGTCANQTVFESLMYNNQYTKTVWAYALKENEINTTKGQYLLSKTASSMNYLAQAVPCYDRHLCYCKPMPVPPPSTLRVIVKNCLDNTPINQASVSVDRNATRASDTQGRVVYYPVAPGTYTVFADAQGYTSNSTGTGPIGNNQTIEKELCLNPLPCTLNVITQDTSGARLSSVLVSLGNLLLGTKTTDPTGVVTWSINTRDASAAFGSLSGYTPQTGGFTCPQGGSANVTLIFPPILNVIRVFVRDIDDNSPIFTASAFLNGNGGIVDNTFARNVYQNVAAGTYNASASAPGYISNWTTAGPVLRNQSIDVYIYLRSLPCNVQVNVLSNNTGLPINQAAVTLNLANSQTLTDANGKTSYVVAHNFSATPTAFATKIGYNNGSSQFACSRGAFVNVTIRLNEVLFVTLAALDGLTNGRPLLPFAKIYWDNVEVTQTDPNNAAFRIKNVLSLPATADIRGTAGGFNPKSGGTITFTLANRGYNLTLAPQQFTLYFIPSEIYPNGSALWVDSTGNVRNNYNRFFTEFRSVKITYEEKPITVGGTAERDVDPPDARSFAANTNITYLSENNKATFLAYAAVFTDQVPTNQSVFDIKLKDLDTLKSNPPVAGATHYRVEVKDFATTEERTVVTELPYKLNAAYFNVRATPVDLNTWAQSNFGDNDFCYAYVYLKRAQRYTNYDSVVLKGSKRAIFESYIIFGDRVTSINIGYPGESFNTTTSNWANTLFEFPNLQPYGVGLQPADSDVFDWPKNNIDKDIFITLGDGQVARNPDARLFFVQDFLLIKNPPRTKRN